MKNKIEVFEEIMFASPAYHLIIKDVDNEEIKKECFEIKKQYPSVKKSNFGGWQSPSIKDIEKKYTHNISILAEKILDIVNEISQEWLIKNLKIDNYWININNKKDFNISHLHPSSMFSAVYYVECDSNSGNIVFERNDNQMYCIKPTERSKYRYDSYWFSPENSKLLVFPSNYKHFVEPSTSDNPRISIAFNFSGEYFE